ncbi:single-stranded DNA-binding protein [Campylobacter sp. RM12651]|uniref:single-stranded DNA-binding protein n=1 Tax=Campylobacter sp. RM12651 TaxID=1660079 RepID=UPI0023BAC15C|nr:single-stranded DNA-binding protein [Campylobacter sp. RM12651]ULO04590.1 single-stranded DNA binding protein [Campylobacter sp. RM12651]
MNVCNFTGRLVNEVMLHTKGQTMWINNTLAIYNRKKVDERWEEDTIFIEFSAFGKNAEMINKYTRKGDRISLIGKITQERWVDKNNNNRTQLKLLVEKIYLIDYIKPDTNKNSIENINDEDSEIPF